MFKKNLINNLILVLLLALTIGFFISRALVSISIGILFIVAVIYLWKHKTGFSNNTNSKLSIIFVGFYVLILVSSLFSGSLDCFTQPVISFAPLLLLPFAFQVFDTKLNSMTYWLHLINWVFISGVLFLLTDTVFRQGFDSEKTIQLAHDSKNIVNTLGIHHNIVGFLAVFSIFYLAESYKRNKKTILLLPLLIIIALIHYLGLRFAIIAFYPLMFIYLLRLRIKTFIKVTSLAVCGVLLVGSFIFIPAFNARYKNTKADFKNIIVNNNPNYWSLNQRLIANEIGLDIAKKNWLFGVGTCNIKQVVNQEYLKNSRLLIPENRKFIHNQLIYGWATFGIFYVVGWMVLFGFLIYKGVKEQSILLELTLLFIMHQMVENTLEKQLMLLLLIYFTLVMPKGLGRVESFRF